ncbi:hypothetical protein [Chelativorans salis]|uniref:Uncharacterized protein n=1 Tax=Chelativorans salis TaxID=2978478 RepID=A0ABT2LLL6_9HYPH|nr:hypothetical protein [Chelativorans sp. EGI FJ00035]MCT7374074.1 hypothetical protein [Chelativorans sp. EGI FJ00035]
MDGSSPERARSVFAPTGVVPVAPSLTALPVMASGQTPSVQASSAPAAGVSSARADALAHGD